MSLPKEIDVGKCLVHICPRAYFIVHGYDDNRIDWRDERPQPTEDEILKAWEEIKYNEETEKFAKESRWKNYLKSRDFLREFDVSSLYGKDIPSGKLNEILLHVITCLRLGS